MNTENFQVTGRLKDAVMESFGLMGLDEQDFEGLFATIGEYSNHRMPIGRVQFEEVDMDEQHQIRISFSLSPMILSSAKNSYLKISTAKWFFIFPDLNMNLDDMILPELLAKSQVRLIDSSRCDLDELVDFLDTETLPFFS